MTVKNQTKKRGARIARQPILDEAALAEGVAALRACDPDRIDALLAVAGAVPLRRREPGFAGLAAIVCGQQLSTKAAAAIWRTCCGSSMPTAFAR